MKKVIGITDERFNELCFLLLVRRQIGEGLVPLNDRDMYDWRAGVKDSGYELETVKMAIAAIWKTVVRFSKLDLQFSPGEIIPDMVHSICSVYLLNQKQKQPLLFGEAATHEWWSIKEFLRQHECPFTDTELAEARVRFSQNWLDAQVNFFKTNLTPAR